MGRPQPLCSEVVLVHSRMVAEMHQTEEKVVRRSGVDVVGQRRCDGEALSKEQARSQKLR